MQIVYLDPNPYALGELLERRISLEEYNVLTWRYRTIDFTMNVDSNRTGDPAQLVAARPDGQARWSWGQNGEGAVILVNNDDDDATRASDCADATVNSPADVADLSPLSFRLTYWLPAGWAASLKVSRADRIRIFNKRDATGVEIIGPTTGDTYTFTPQDLSDCYWGGLEFGMEGVAYAAGDFDGDILLTLTAAYLGTFHGADSAFVMVAPWMMTHHGMPARVVHVAEFDWNRAFRQALDGYVGAANCALFEHPLPTLYRAVTANDLIDLARMYRDVDAQTDRDSDGMVYLLERDNNFDMLQAACVVCPKSFSYDDNDTSLANLANHCTTAMNGTRMTEQQLRDYSGDGIETNEQSLIRGGDPLSGVIAIPGYLYLDANDLTVDRLWWLCLRFHPTVWLEEWMAMTENGVRNIERLLPLPATVGVPEGNDCWMQDCMEIGVSSIPGQRIHSVLRARRNRELRAVPQSLLDTEFGYHAPVPTRDDTTFDSHGNLEVTPPFELASGKRYPWGRIYYGKGRRGQAFDPIIKDFLEKQVVQEPIALDTDWLSVGHVDEMLTFVPAPQGGRQGFPYKLVIASSRLAWQILLDHENDANQEGMFRRRWRGLTYKFGTNDEQRIDRRSIAEFLQHGLPLRWDRSRVPGTTRFDLFGVNTRVVQGHLDRAKTALVQAMELQQTDIIEAPILFFQNRRGEHDALTTGMVNMLVINDHCIVPRPFGPVVNGVDLYQDHLDQALTNIGLTVHWIDDWDEYHTGHGEVHCGTNTRRIPAAADLRWWEYVP